MAEDKKDFTLELFSEDFLDNLNELDLEKIDSPKANLVEDLALDNLNLNLGEGLLELEKNTSLKEINDDLDIQPLDIGVEVVGEDVAKEEVIAEEALELNLEAVIAEEEALVLNVESVVAEEEALELNVESEVVVGGQALELREFKKPAFLDHYQEPPMPPRAKDFLEKYESPWAAQEQVSESLSYHYTKGGERFLILKFFLPPLFSGNLLKGLAVIARNFEALFRFSQDGEGLFIFSREDNLEKIQGELRGLKLFFPQNDLLFTGSGGSFLSCPQAAFDIPSLKTELRAAFAENLALPAPLEISLACCPALCGASPRAEVFILGANANPPIPLEPNRLALGLDIEALISSCPTGALRVEVQGEVPKGLQGVRVQEELCVKCFFCQKLSRSLDLQGPDSLGLAIYINLDRKSPPKKLKAFLPNNPALKDSLVATLRGLVHLYQREAQGGQTLGDFVGHYGWEAFLKRVNEHSLV